MERDRGAVDPVEQAAAWRGQAGVLRRRAARGSATDEERAEALRRADWYEARADVVDKCYPESPIFPHALRTPVDSLDLVDDLRRSIERTRAIAAAMTIDEFDAFRASLRRSAGERGDPALAVDADDRALAELRAVLEHATAIGPFLGILRGLFTSYDVEVIARESDDVATCEIKTPTAGT